MNEREARGRTAYLQTGDLCVLKGRPDVLMTVYDRDPGSPLVRVNYIVGKHRMVREAHIASNLLRLHRVPQRVNRG